jgi:hypothetical protein
VDLVCFERGNALTEGASRVRFVVYLDPEGTTWPPPTHPPGPPVILEADPEATLEEVASEAIRTSGEEMYRHYFFADSGPHYWLEGLSDAAADEPDLVPFPRVVIDANGEFLWSEGARSRITLADLQRSRDAGFYEGDPGGIFLERPMFGEAPPGWEDFLQWISQFASAIGGVIGFVALVRKGLDHLRNRGAATPYAYLDIVVGREEWNRDQLRQLLRLDEKEVVELLETLGFVPDPTEPKKWRAQPDPGRSTLRGKIIHDWLHHPAEDEVEDDENGDGP